MTLEDLGNLGDFVGGLAVIATLLYLAVQIRQNTKILRASAEPPANPLAAIGLTAQNPENAAVYHKGLADPSELSPEERTHFFLLISTSFYVLQQGYLAHELGTQSEATWKWQLYGLRFYAAQPGVRTWWRRQGKQLFDSESDFWRVADAEMRKHEAPAV